MRRRRRSVLVAAATVACLAAWTAPAQASVTFGSDLGRSASAQQETCPTASCTVVAHSYPAANTLPATAPIDGVIVLVRVKSNSADTGTLRLARFSGGPPSPTGPSATGAGTGDTYTFGNIGQIEEFPARLPVEAGDHLAADGQSSSAYNCGTSNSSVGMSFVYSPRLQDNFTGPFSDPDGPGCELLANAVIEADGDGDGFGDETQDECAGTAGPVNGCLPPSGAGSIVTGVISDSGGHPVQASWVSVCDQDFFPCKTDRSNSSGGYSVTGLPAGNYTVFVYPPTGNYAKGRVGPVAVSGANGAVFTQDVQLGPGPKPPPPGTSIGPNHRNPSDPNRVPTVYLGEPLSLSTQGCSGGVATFQIRVDGTLRRSGSLTEQPAGSGTYQGTVNALQHSGDGAVKISIDCPGPTPDEVVEFNIYIDPSGVVSNANTGQPINGATVTLVRSDDPAGPFVEVPDGSDIMSPSNRTNPDTTEADGKFAWDVIAGFYKVQATAPGCEPGETAVLTIPPPALDLEIALSCPPPQITDTDPDSPANQNNPLVKGAAEPGSTVRIYRAAECPSGTPLGSDVASVFSSPGIGISVPDNSTTDLRATATDAAGNTSACSDVFTYEEVTPPSDVDGDGVPDSSDGCPNQPGPASNAGCPLPESPPDPGIGGGPDTTAPEGVITKGPPNKSKSKTATFEFSGNEPGATFECRLDSAAFASCTSPKRYSGLKKGSHTFEVRAKDAAGNTDQTPAVQTWTIKKKKKKK